ncbi:hypothetical protein D3C81_2143240 [compost metagenome]
MQGRADHQADIAERQRAADFDFLGDAAAFKLPAVHRAAGEAMADARQAVQVLGFVRGGMPLEECR